MVAYLPWITFFIGVLVGWLLTWLMMTGNKRDLESKVALEVRQDWLDLHESRERIAVTEQAVEQAEENLKVARNLYKAGLVTHTEVLDAVRLRTSTTSNHDTAVYDADLAGLRLRRSLGEL